MSIVKLNKVTLFGLCKDKQALLERLQDIGCMHVLPLGGLPEKVEKVASAKADNTYKALKFLSDLPNQRRQLKSTDNFNVEVVTEEVLQLQMDIRRAEDKIALLEARLKDIENWGNIEYPTTQTINGIRLWYYKLPLAKVDSLTKVPLPWCKVYQDHKFAYVVVLAKEEPPEDVLPIPRTHLGSKSQRTLLKELDDTELALDELNVKRFSYTRFIYLLTVNIAKANDMAAFNAASQKTLQDNNIIAIQGWIPADKVSDIEALATTLHLAIQVAPPQVNEVPPTLLAQPNKLKAAKDLAMFYQTPNYFGWDPSKMLFVSFSLFFAMILADAGYGLLLLGVLFLYWKRLSGSIEGVAYRLLGLSLTISTVIYGVLVGSYFGVTPPDTSVLATFKIIDVNDFDLMMQISIIVGALHIGIANLSMAYVYRHRRFALAKVGWFIVIVAGVTYWLSPANTTASTGALALGGVGIALIILFTSNRAVKKPLDHLLRLFDGVFSLTGLMNLFGDILSYMRLFALGLASASLAITFNGLATDAKDSIAGGGLLVALLILLIGHALNLVLSLMSGVVHGLRLNYIEFYNWGQDEEGTAFESFSRTEIKHDRQ